MAFFFLTNALWNLSDVHTQTDKCKYTSDYPKTMMHLFSWRVLFFFLLLGNPVKSVIETSCRSTISLSCGDDYIIITDINTTSSLVPYLLEHCNAHGKCSVPNIYNECFKLTYWCRMEFPMFELKRSATTKIDTSSSVFAVMSEDYSEGRHQEAENVYCSFQPTTSGNNTLRQIKFIIYELAPFTDHQRFCLSLQGSPQFSFCSGSRKFYTTFESLYSRDGLEIRLTLAHTAMCTPMVRFWIEIQVSPDDDPKMVCRSEPALVPVKTAMSRNEMVVPLWSVVVVCSTGGVCLLGFLILCMAVFKQSRHTTHTLQEQSVDENNHSTYAELNEDIQLPTLRPAHNRMRSHSFGSLKNVSHVPRHLLPPIPADDHKYQRMNAVDVGVPPGVIASPGYVLVRAADLDQEYLPVVTPGVTAYGYVSMNASRLAEECSKLPVNQETPNIVTPKWRHSL